MVPHARHLSGLALRIGTVAPGQLATEVERLSGGLQRHAWPGLRMQGVGPLSPAVVEQFELSGPVARASGQLPDARLDGPLTPTYGSLGFEPQGLASGDDLARFCQRLAEAVQSLRLVEAARSLKPARLEINRTQTLALETSRGRYAIRLDGGGSRKHGHEWRVTEAVAPSESLLRILPELLIGVTYADALVIVDGLDPCAEEVENRP
jgi:Ni,Fe-hydrogenase III large subunit